MSTPKDPNTVQVDDSSLEGLLLQFALAAAVTGVCLSAFELLRKAKPEIYSPRTHFNRRYALKSAPSGMFAWISAVWHYDDSSIDDLIGGDATVMILYLKYATVCFAAAALLGLFVLIPVNVNAGGDQEVAGLDRLSMANVADGSAVLWVHCIAAWVISTFTFIFLIRMHYRYIKLFHAQRRRTLNTHTGRTLMIDSLPSDLRTDTSLEEYCTSLPLGDIESVHVYRNLPELSEKLVLYDKFLRQYESTAVKFSNTLVKKRLKIASTPKNEWMLALDDDTERQLWRNIVRNPSLLENIPTKYVPTIRLQLYKKVNALDYTSNKMDTYYSRVVRIRSSLDTMEYGETHVAFLTLVKASDAVKAAQALIHTKPLKCLTSMAPEPRNIIWDHLKHGWRHKMVAGVVVNALTVALTFFWLIPVTLIVSLTSLSQLSQWIPKLGDFANQSALLRGFLQNVLPVILTSFLMSLLPSILYALTKQEKPKTFSSLENKTFARYYFFLLFNIFLVFTLGGTFLKSFNQIVDNPPSIVNILAAQLPNNATFFINYVVLGLSGFAMEMLQISRLLISYLKNYLYRTPRARVEFFKKLTLDYYCTFPPFVLMFTISLAYSVIAPLITVFAAIYFGLNYFAYKYQILYVYSPAYETGGKMWPLVFDMTTTGIMIYQLTLIGLLSLKGVILPSIFVIPLLIITLAFRYYCKKKLKQYSENLPLELSAVVKEDGNVERADNVIIRSATDEEEGGTVGTDTQRTDAYFYEQADYDQYINPALVEELEEVWLPESMDGVTDAAIDWSRCGRSGSRAAHTPSRSALVDSSDSVSAV